MWQLFINYGDFGFVRRGLVGTVFTASGANKAFQSEYIFAFVIHHVALLLVALLVFLYLAKYRLANRLFAAGVILSPTFIIHIGYNTGSLDVFVLLIVIGNMLFVRGRLLFSMLLIVGLFTHELFIFAIPAQFSAFLLRRHVHYEVNDLPDVLRLMSLPIAAAAIAVLLLLLFGRLDMPQPQFDSVMAGLMPNAVGNHSLWSGYDEVSLSTDSSFTLRNVTYASQNWHYLIVPVSYLLILLRRMYAGDGSVFRRSIEAVSTLTPLLASFVASDIHRWIALSANLAILLTLVMYTHGRRVDLRWDRYIILFTLLAPFGGAELARPLPMHQFLIESIGRWIAAR